MVSLSIGLKVARSITSVPTPSASSSAAARKVSCVMAPQVTMVTSLPSRSTKQRSKGSACPSSVTSWRTARYSRTGSKNITGSGSRIAASSSP